MRLEIKTKKPIKDKEVKALYIIRHALNMIRPRMVGPTLDFFNGRYKANELKD